MEIELARYLVSSSADKPLQSASAMVLDRVPAVSALTRLRSSCDGDQARAVWELAVLRAHAFPKLGPDAACLYFDREAYEMASGLVTSTYHAERFREAGCRHVADLCAGAGLDTLAFLRAGLTVTSIERDPARAVFVEANCRVLGSDEAVTVINGDCRQINFAGGDAAFFDPARRSGDRRWAASAEDTDPPLSFVNALKDFGIERLGVKLSPAINRSVNDIYPGELEFISDHGECKEAMLWIGGLGIEGITRATLLPQRHTLAAQAINGAELRSDHGKYLWEPDAAVIRAGLTPVLTAETGGWQVDPAIAYFFTDRLVHTPFATAYKVLEALPFKRKLLQEALRRFDAGRLIIKSRGFPLSVEQVAAQFPVRGTKEVTLVVTQLATSAQVFVVERVRPADQVQSRA